MSEQQYEGQELVDGAVKCWKSLGFINDRLNQALGLVPWFLMQREVGHDKAKAEAAVTIAYLKEQVAYLKGEIDKAQQREAVSATVFRDTINSYREELKALYVQIGEKL